jgi:cyclohexanecarboxyl-CoA dehydrogenase
MKGVRIPGEYLIGEEGKGFSQVMHGFAFSRAWIGLQCIGAAQVTVDATWQYVTNPVAFDQLLSKKQCVAFPPVEAETVLSAARLLCYGTLWRKDRGLPQISQAAKCRWWARETAFEVIQSCLLLHGPVRLPDRVADRAAPARGARTADRRRHAQIMNLIIARQRIGKALAP